MALTSGTKLGPYEIQSPGVRAQIAKIVHVVLAVLLWGTLLAGQKQKPFPVTSVVNQSTIAGHPLQLDGQGNRTTFELGSSMSASCRLSTDDRPLGTNSRRPMAPSPPDYRLKASEPFVDCRHLQFTS